MNRTCKEKKLKPIPTRSTHDTVRFVFDDGLERSDPRTGPVRPMPVSTLISLNKLSLSSTTPLSLPKRSALSPSQHVPIYLNILSSQPLSKNSHPISTSLPPSISANRWRNQHPVPVKKDLSVTVLIGLQGKHFQLHVEKGCRSQL
ncbi:hypothetical protein CFOL_v3_27208 [Cephalotus follicularis]|uniref:Uncharacterized protein n=1 Tax=Cephalotus follicularis TaxID=3775 RepID=A0A1Q3CUM0_CEPFO|nr:hypothetical protein CFOL_v3_27208 [Cephalotus follicularis]